MATKNKSGKYSAFVNSKGFKSLSKEERRAAIAGLRLAREESRERKLDRREDRRKALAIKQRGLEARKFFTDSLKKDSPESRQARSGRSFVKGVSSSLRGGSGRGLKAIIKLPRVAGWSDMGLIAGSPFRDYESRNVFPSSRPDRSLHPQEKAEIDAALQKIKLFGINPSPLSIDNKKKKNEEVL